MIAKELITQSIIPLKTSDTGADALNIMEEFKVSHLPIVNNVDFLGVISETDIYNINSNDESIGSFVLTAQRPFVLANQHIFDVLKIISNLNLSLIPVVDDKNNYMGCITIFSIVKSIANLMSADNPGGLIVLELNVKDYSLAQIAQIVESNDAIILSAYSNSFSDSTKLEVTIKINKSNITPIIQTFNRYNYIIKATFAEEEYNDYLKDRYESFMNYLGI